MNRQFEEFCTLITEINSEITAIKIKATEDLGLRGSHVMILYELEKHGSGMTGAMLSETLSLDKAAVSRALSGLEKKGLTEVSNTEGKRRYRAAVRLTPSGRKAAQRLDARIDAAVGAGAVGNFSDEERERFYESLRTISKQLKQYRETLQ